MKPATETIAAGEVWKPITGYDGKYEVSNFGNVRSIDRHIIDSRGVCRFQRGRILKPYISVHGYVMVVLFNNSGQTKNWQVHRLVATYFVSGHKDGLIVNHKDENRRNNRADNLEWCTYKYNLDYSDVIGKRTPKPLHRRQIIQYTKDGTEVERFKSIGYAANKVHVSTYAIALCCKGKTKSCAGYKWRYVM